MKRIAPALLLLLPLSLLAAAGKFGAPLGDSPKVALADLVKDPAAWSGKTVKTEGVVSTVCQEKGCWMVLKSGDRSVRVTFKDYGFFVPLDSKGMKARAAGVTAIKVLSKADADHLEGEGAAKLKRNADGTANEVSFIATGVELRSSR